MRAVHVLAIAAFLALGATVAPTDVVQAQNLLDMSPPADSSAQIGQPKYDDIKLQTGTALPPKSGSVIPLSARRLQLDMIAPPRSERAPAARVSPK